jgi:hypothetical protein
MYNHLLPIFKTLNHGCTKGLILKLFYLANGPIGDLSVDMFGLIIKYMFGSIDDISTIFEYDKIDAIFKPISMYSYDLKIVLDKYCGDDEIGITILKHISDNDYKMKTKQVKRIERKFYDLSVSDENEYIEFLKKICYLNDVRRVNIYSSRHFGLWGILLNINHNLHNFVCITNINDDGTLCKNINQQYKKYSLTRDDIKMFKLSCKVGHY